MTGIGTCVRAPGRPATRASKVIYMAQLDLEPLVRIFLVHDPTIVAMMPLATDNGVRIVRQGVLGERAGVAFQGRTAHVRWPTKSRRPRKGNPSSHKGSGMWLGSREALAPCCCCLNKMVFAVGGARGGGRLELQADSRLRVREAHEGAMCQALDSFKSMQVNWDQGSGGGELKPVATVVAHTANCTNIAIDGKADHFATGAYDGSVCIWCCRLPARRSARTQRRACKARTKVYGS